MGMVYGLRSLTLARKDIFNYGEIPVSTKSEIFMIDKMTPGKMHIPYGFHSNLQEMYKKMVFTHYKLCKRGCKSSLCCTYSV